MTWHRREQGDGAPTEWLGPMTPTRSLGVLFVMLMCPLLVLELGLMPGFLDRPGLIRLVTQV